MCNLDCFNTCFSWSQIFFRYLAPFTLKKKGLVTSLVYALINEWRKPTDTLICLISVGYHLELNIAIAFYREYHLLPK